METQQQNEFDSLKEVASTKNGRSFLWMLLCWCKVYESTFSLEPLQSAFGEGQREIGLKLLKMIEMVEDGLIYKIAIENMEGKRK